MNEEKHLKQDIEYVEASNLLESVQDLKNDGYRLVQACACNKENGIELWYSFDKDHALKNLFVQVPPDDTVHSITGMYWCGFIYENEIHDLFGVKFKNMEMDFGGNFFVLAEKTPWRED